MEGEREMAERHATRPHKQRKRARRGGGRASGLSFYRGGQAAGVFNLAALGEHGVGTPEFNSIGLPPVALVAW